MWSKIDTVLRERGLGSCLENQIISSPLIILVMQNDSVYSSTWRIPSTKLLEGGVVAYKQEKKFSTSLVAYQAFLNNKISF